MALVTFALTIAVLTAGTGAQPTPPTGGADGSPNFDIRLKESASADQLAYLQRVSPALSSLAAAAIQARVAGVARLEAADGALAIEAHPTLGAPEVVSAMPGGAFLTPPSTNRVAALRAFLASYADAYGVTAPQVQSLDVVADHVNPAGNMAWVELEQSFNGIPVFQGVIRGGFTAKGELARTTGTLASFVDGKALATAPTLSERQAIALVAASVGWKIDEGALVNRGDDGAGHATFGGANMADDAKAWLVYFPMGPGVVRLAWATEVWGDPMAYLVLLDAEDGTVLFRKNLTNFQTQTATYVIYNDDSPAPLSPSTALPGANTQAPVIARSTQTLIGNEAPNTFNTNGWITDGLNITDGNNLEAGLDIDMINGVDAPVPGVARVFDFAYNPAPGNPGPGDAPTGALYRNGEVTNMFYWSNVFHDRLYLLGFNELAGNFQHDNFGRGGAQADRISAEAQDSSGTNNANFATPADGGRGRMQMFVFPNTNPARTSGLDNEVLLHELTHGLSNRLHSNASGLTSLLARGLGEGWSDFYARALLSTASEDVDGIYSTGGWVTHLITGGGYTDNYYYGIRRFPYAVKSNVGANGKPHNPLTFKDIDPAQIDLTDGAFPNGPIGSPDATEVHNTGEVWSMMLLEVRARFIARLGFATGNQRVLQFITDGMKLDPVNPTFIQARDAIIAAANTGGGTPADIADIWAGFATRGMGVLASQAGFAVVESYLTPSDPLPTFSIDDVSVVEGQSGTTTAAFTVTLSNPLNTTHRVNFVTANNTAVSPTLTFTSSAAITIPAGAPVTSDGPATPYPATVNVAGVSGAVANVALRLDDLSHTFPRDLDVLLVGPGGQKVLVMADLGAGTDVNDIDLTFQDGAPAPPAALVSGTFAPTNLNDGGLDTFNAPAPAAPYEAALSVFNGTDPNGTWSLFVMDDQGADVGSMDSFSLLITPAGAGDYVHTSGELVFLPGTTTQPVNVTVNGDTTNEPNETFFVNLSNPINATITDAQGLGTILNDDGTPPVAVADSYAASSGAPLTVAAPGVLGNDNPNGGNALSAELVTTVTHGTLTLNADGSFAYTSTAGYTGPDSFSYRVSNNLGVSAAVAVALTVSPAVPLGPQPPTGLFASSIVGNVLTLRFTPPTSGPAPTGYTLEGGVNPGETLASIPTGSTAPIYTIAAPNGSFFLRMRTLTSEGPSGPSNEIHVFINTPTAPSAPENLLALVNGSNLSLAWRNTFTGGAPTSIILDVTGSLSGSVPIPATDAVSFPGVPAGTYTISLRAANGAGVGGSSNPVTVTIPGACSGAPLTPANFLAFKNGSTVSLLWDPAASGPAPTSFVLNVTGSFTGSFPLPGRSISAIAPPGTYNFTVQATNPCGSSAATGGQTLTIP